MVSPHLLIKTIKLLQREGRVGFQKTFLTRPLVSLMSEGQPMINVVLLNKGST